MFLHILFKPAASFVEKEDAGVRLKPEMEDKMIIRSSRTTIIVAGIIGASTFMLAGQSFAHTAKGAHGSKTSIKVSGGKRCITGNGLPNHDTGSFPNRGNPNSISSQRIRLCVTTNPRKGSSPRQVNGSIGVGVNGVQFRPGTADYYDPSSRRGFSRNPEIGRAHV